ncbi:MAG TPA: DUF6766 family protein [Thermoanaerobaculia bacterium]|jgi:hypothetical protein|nr:DUF6766 family protein [Thermoanaerobaculia bacterium]
MRRFLRENGLSLVLFWLFFLTFIVGQSVAGHLQNNEELEAHGQPSQGMGEYLRSHHFWEATTENWESEFLQMFVYVVLTAFLYQKGSSESKKLDEPNEVDRDPRKSQDNKDAPWPVRRGGLVLRLYENSLSLAFLLMFLLSFFLHGVSGRGEYNEEQVLHGQPVVSLGEYMVSSRFWFESLQNWQSEFLAMWAMVVLSIWLRQKGSPESKPVDSPHAETGSG